MSKLRVLFAGTLLSMVPLLAHHQFSSEFDANKPVTLSGTIQSVEWKNPHALFHITSTDGQTVTLEAASPSTLDQRGYGQSMFKAGTNVTFDAYQGINDTKMASARAVTLPDGRKISVSDPSEDGGPAPRALTSPTLASPSALPQTGSDLPLVGLIGVLAAGGFLILSLGKRVSA
jgi:LPXTG-motif cell wall-anchored protein